MLQLTEVDDPGQWRRNLGRGRLRRAVGSMALWAAASHGFHRVPWGGVTGKKSERKEKEKSDTARGLGGLL
jgi:hypothetical protein